MNDDELERLHRRAVSAVGRGRVTLVDDGSSVQRLQVQVSARELLGTVPRLGEYGLQSHPPIDTDTVVVFLGNDRSNGVVIATSSQAYRLRNLASGEVALSDDKGQSVYLSAAGIRVDGGGNPVEVSNAPKVTITATQIELNGEVTINGPTILNGPISQTAGAPGGTEASLVGPVTVATEVIVNGVGVHDHTHGGIVRGSLRTDGPLTP